MGSLIVPLSTEWHAARRVRISSTDVAAILGVSVEEGKYRESTPYGIAARIKGLIPPSEADDSDLLWAGTESEDLNARIYMRVASREGNEDRVVDRSLADFRIHPKFDWLCSTTDGCVRKESRQDLGLWSAKMPLYTARKWKDGPPLAFNVQEHVSMSIRGLSWASISGLTLPSVAWADIECNERFMANMLEVLQAWWDRYIVGDDMPGVEAGDSPLLRDLHRPEPKKTIFLPLALSDAAEELADKLATIKALEEEAEKLKAQLQQHMLAEKAEIALTADGKTGWKFTKQIQNVKAKPATEASTREVVKFEKYTPKE